MGRRLIISSVASLCFLAFIAGGALAYDAENPMILKCGVDNPETDIMAKTMKKLGELVAEKTQGRIKFQYFFGGSLIKKPQFVDAVTRNIAQITTGPGSFVSGKIPELSIFEVSGAFRLDKFPEVQKTIAPFLEQIMTPREIHHVMIMYNGPEIYSHRNKFLKSPNEWKGQKMRVSGTRRAKVAVKWGASTVFLTPGDLYLAVQRGVIDGFSLVYDVVNGLKLYEVAPFITDSGFNSTIEMVPMNLKVWNEMTPEDQRLFTQAAEETVAWNYKESQTFYNDMAKNIESKGGKIYKLTPEEQSVYVKDAKDLIPEVREAAGPIGNKMIDALEPLGIK